MKKRLFSLMLVLVLSLSLALPAFADSTGLLRDEADLLTSRAEESLEAELERISRAYGVDVIVLTVNTVGNNWVDDFANVYYDTHFGPGHDGVMLVLAMAEREYRILSNGLGYDAIPDAEIDEICGHIEPYLRDGDYAEAFARFAQDCAYELDGLINGFPFDWSGAILISLVVGFLVAGIVVLVLAMQLRSTGRRTNAQGYARKGSFQLTSSSDIFLYRNVSRRARERDSSHGGGSGGGRSGGGRGMGGGRF